MREKGECTCLFSYGFSVFEIAAVNEKKASISNTEVLSQSRRSYRQGPKIILSVCRALEFSPAQANQALTERLVRELAPV